MGRAARANPHQNNTSCLPIVDLLNNLIPPRPTNTSNRTMRALPLIIALCISSQVSLAVPILSHREPPPPYLVKTTSGNYIGHPSKSSPDVIEYFGIQYAQAPIDSLRFAAPEPFVSNETFDASEQPPDCPYVAYNWGTVPGELYSHAGRIMSQESADGYNIMSEDCLYMDIWAKSGGSAEKPVLFFVYGGGSYSLFEDPAESGGVIHIFDSDNDKGFERGSVNNPTYNGVYFAEREDVDRITMFGQSQGAWIISWYSYAFANDTIASAFIQESGSGFSDLSSTADERAAVWRNASATVGCDQAPDSRILDCMRAQNVSSVLAAIQSVPLVGAAPPFGPLIDEKLIFSNYTEKTLAGEFAQKVLPTSNPSHKYDEPPTNTTPSPSSWAATTTKPDSTSCASPAAIKSP